MGQFLLYQFNPDYFGAFLLKLVENRFIPADLHSSEGTPSIRRFFHYRFGLDLTDCKHKLRGALPKQKIALQVDQN